jgi:polyhydroxyalkanoate synthase
MAARDIDASGAGIESSNLLNRGRRWSAALGPFLAISTPKGDDMTNEVAELGRKVTPSPIRKAVPNGKAQASSSRTDADPQQTRDDHENRDSETRPIGTTSEKLSGQFSIGDFHPGDLVDTARDVFSKVMRQPMPMIKARAGLAGELLKVAVGQSSLAPEPGDKRFADPAWQQNTLYKGLMQSYLAWSQSLQQYASNFGADAQESSRVAFLMSQVSDALSPTNTLGGNPAVLKKTIETGGANLRRGVSNLLGDVSAGRAVPSQSDDRPFKVGENLACTPGAVVLRTEMFELLQYTPQTPKVHERPMVFIPAIVNKYYAFDLAPGRSMMEHFVKNGITVFLLVWRNPRPEHDHWGIPEYQESIDTAIDAAREITNAQDVNLWGVCGASPAVVGLLGYYAATRQRKVNSLVLMVPLLDMSGLSQAEGIGGFVDPKLMARSKRRKAKRKSARDFSLLFGMLRSNDLIWNYWVNNYLLGNDPPVFDILTWNNDGTGMTAKFGEDFAELTETNPLLERGKMQVRGTPIAGVDDLGIDCYVLGAATDHLCRWPGVYKAAQMLGDRCEFVLGSSGHIQTLVCPPGNPKTAYYTNADKPATSEQWLAGATRHSGTWWDHCVAWTTARSGSQIDAPSAPGSTRFPAVGKAPGLYVLEKV